jgi:hypothetical protein
MKKISLCLILLVVCFVWGYAQTQEATLAEPAAVVSTDEPQIIEIQIKAFMPDITVVKIKSDTYNHPGEYSFSISKKQILEISKEQLIQWNQELTKWLEESK